MQSDYPPQTPRSASSPFAPTASSPLDPPHAPFAHSSSGTSLRSQSPGPSVSDSTTKGRGGGGDSGNGAVSLSINYLPSKFSQPGFRKRKNNSDGAGNALLPKRGGGREAFRSNADRMPQDGDDDYDGVEGNLFGGSKDGKGKKMHWNRFKWQLFGANLLLSAYSLTALIFCLLTWLNVWTHADVVRVGNTTELIISTCAAALGIITSLIGWSGILLNNRAFLAVYTLLLWGCFALLVTPGYITYKKRTFNLEGKINAEWSQDLGQDGRLRIQNQLKCCGYFSPFVEATISQTCYSRSTLPGCKGPYLAFEQEVLTRWYTVAFALVPVQLFVIVTGLLCSNHITYRFGKGMMPKAYRLSMNSMAVIMDNYANQLAEQYGPDVASEVLNRSRSNLGLESLPTMPYSPTMDALQHYGPGSHLSAASATSSTAGAPGGPGYAGGQAYGGAGGGGYGGRQSGPGGEAVYSTLAVDPPTTGYGGEGRRRVPYDAHTPPASEYGYGGAGVGGGPASPIGGEYPRRL